MKIDYESTKICALTQKQIKRIKKFILRYILSILGISVEIWNIIYVHYILFIPAYLLRE